MRFAIAVLLLLCPAADAKKPRKASKPAVDGRTQHILDPKNLPQDFLDMGMREYHQVEQSVLAVFKDKVEFHRLPREVYLGKRGLTDGARAFSLLELKPLNARRFSSPFEVSSAGNTLLCTHPALPKTAREGVEDFCGVLSIDGELLFEFPFEQHMPYDMLQILAMAEDGRYAEVFVGRFVPSLDGRHFAVVEPREILGWHYPDRLKRFDGPWKEAPPRDGKKAMESVLKGFGERSRRP